MEIQEQKITKKLVLEFLLKEIRNISPENWGLTPDETIEKERINNFAASLLKPIIQPKELGLTYATIKYWEQKEYLLLPNVKEIDEWRKFSILELVWIEFLKKIHKMGCDLETFAPKLIFAYANKHNENETILFDYETPEYARNRINGILITPVSTLLFQLIKIFITQARVSVHFFDKECQFTSELGKGMSKATVSNTAYKIMYKSGVSICISDIALEVLYRKNLPQLQEPKVLNEQEIEILNLLKKKELKEITIKLDNGKPFSLELKERFDINKDDASKRLKEFFFSPYQEIKAVTNGGKTIAFERTTKRKLNE